MEFRGFSTIGEVKEKLGAIRVATVEFMDAISGKRGYGIAINVKESGRLSRDINSFIDYDEIESLLKGIDYITKVDKSVTKIDRYEAEYRTKGDFRIVKFSVKTGNVSVAFHSGVGGGVAAYLSSNGLASFRKLIEQAKSNLDSIKQ